MHCIGEDAAVTTTDIICRGGSRSFVGAVWPAAPTNPTNRFVEAAGVISRPYKSICRGGWYCSRPYKSIYRGGLGTPAAPTNRFVGAATVPTAPTNHFSAKKKLNLQFKFDIYFSCTTPSWLIFSMPRINVGIWVTTGINWRNTAVQV